MTDKDEWALQVLKRVREYDKVVIGDFLAKVDDLYDSKGYASYSAAVNDVYAEMFPEEAK